MNAELWDLLRTEGLMGASITGDDAREIVERVERLESALRDAERQLARFMDAQSENGLRLRIAELLAEPVTP